MYFFTMTFVNTAASSYHVLAKFILLSALSPHVFQVSFLSFFLILSFSKVADSYTDYFNSKSMIDLLNREYISVQFYYVYLEAYHPFGVIRFWFNKTLLGFP